MSLDLKMMQVIIFSLLEIYICVIVHYFIQSIICMNT